MATKRTTRDGVLRGGTALAVRLLILTAAAISAYLLSVSLSGGQAAGCAPGSPCDAVLQSRWAYLFGVPVSAFAVIIDLAIFAVTFACRPGSTPKQRQNAWEILLPASILVLGAVLWFVALQAFFLRQFCPWCMAAHGCATVAAILLLSRVPIGGTTRSAKDPGLAPRRALQLAGVALGAVALLGIAQVAVAPKTYSVRTIDLGTNLVVIPEVRQPRLFEVYGAVQLNLDEVPLFGSPDAPHKLVSLYDYTCHHCEIMHSRVLEVQRAFSNEVAVISLPMPLDAECNAALRMTSRPHLNACTYAKLGLAVWRARPAALLPYDEWFFGVFAQTRVPPSLVDATNRAVELVGNRSAFESALHDPWIEDQLRKDITIYLTSNQRYQRGNMPQFIIGTNLVTGSIETTALKEIVGRTVNAGR